MDILKKMTDKMTGKGLEEKIGQYSEVYGEVLLGMHRDIESQKKLVHDYRQEAVSYIDEVRLLKEEFERYKHESADKIASLEKQTKLQSMCLVTLLAVCIGLGVLVWTVR